MIKVEHLKKVSVRLQAQAFPGSADTEAAVLKFDFIFGLAPGGMTPFEYEIVGRAEGEEVSFNLKKKDVRTFFEHLDPRIANLFDAREEVCLHARIVAVSSADNREIIRAMAEMAAHSGGGCDCGCGCE